MDTQSYEDKRRETYGNATDAEVLQAVQSQGSQAALDIAIHQTAQAVPTYAAGVNEAAFIQIFALLQRRRIIAQAALDFSSIADGHAIELQNINRAIAQHLGIYL